MMTEQREKEKKGKMKRMSKEKRFYLATALGCVVALIAIVVSAVVATNGNVDNQANKGNQNNSSTLPPTDEPNNGGDNNGNNNGNNNQGNNNGDQTVVIPQGMVMPVQSVSVINDYGFYHNKTLNSYYEHTGLDFAAEVGTEVLAVESGTIESVYSGDLLLGTEIVVDHGDGLKSVYRFVTAAEGLKAGDKVEKGDVIATIAEANGNEYKDGAHLHFEIVKDGKVVDPTTYLTLEEK